MNTSQAKSAIERILNDQARLEAAAQLKAKWAGHLDQVVRHPTSFGGIAIPPRDPIMGKWFKQGDLGFIYGPRGLGKTWLGMFLARRCAEGPGSTGALVEWTVHAPRRILYIDGEMAMDEIRDRDHALTIGPAPGIFYLQHEALFHLTGEILNLTDPVTQSSILDKCKRDRIDILILDNQSCLFPGLSENAADAWDHVLPWLLQLRRNRIAVIIIAHAGRNGLMRGTSRREDAADWIINLTEPKEPVENQAGASFVARFVKNRTTAEADVPTLEWTFIRPSGNPNNKMQITWKKLTPSQLFRQCIEDGMNVGTQIAQHLGISAARVSQLATKGAKDGWLRKSGRHYAIKPPSPFSPGWASRPSNNNSNNNNPELTKSE